MKKRVVHFEIGCNDIAKATEFYRNVFDWKLEQHGNTARVDTGEETGIGGHLNQLGPDEPENYVTVYIETDSIEADLEAVAANGGKRFVGPIQLPDGRQFAWFIDVAGNTIGLITTKPV